MRGSALASLAILAVLSGCAGPGGEPAEPLEADEAAAGAAAAGAWSTQTYTGDFVTTSPVNPGGLTGDVDEFPLPEGVAEAWFNITVAGDLPGDVDVRYNEPGCDQVSCIEDRPVTGGTLSTHYDEPDGGQWEVLFFAPSGAQRGTYVLEVAVRLATEADDGGERASRD